MKITLVDFAGPNFPGGCEKYISTLTKYLSGYNETTFLYSKQYVSFMERIYALLNSHKIGTIDYTKRDIGNAKKLDISLSSFIPFTKKHYELRSRLKESDVIYSKNEFQELLFLYLFLGKSVYSKKVVVGMHTSVFIPSSVTGVWRVIHDFQYNSVFYRRMLVNAKKIHVINRGYIKKITEFYGVSPSKIKYVSYYIDWKTRVSVAGNKKLTILWAGRYTSQKGLDRLKYIIEQLSNDRLFNRIKIMIAGAGECKPLVSQLVKKYKNVSDIGFQHSMEKIYPNINLSFVTSYFETFGYNVLEPQSYGIPVISYRINGPEDIIENGKTGYLVSNTDEFIEKSLKTIKHLLKDNQDLIPGKEIFNRINNKFSKSVILEKMGKIFFDKNV